MDVCSLYDTDDYCVVPAEICMVFGFFNFFFCIFLNEFARMKAAASDEGRGDKFGDVQQVRQLLRRVVLPNN